MQHGITIWTYAIFWMIVALIGGLALIVTRKKDTVTIFGYLTDGKLFRKVIAAIIVVLALPIPIALILIGGSGL